MSKSHPRPSRPLQCIDARFVEVEFTRPRHTRLVIEFREGISLLLEDSHAIPLAAEFIAAYRKHLSEEKGGQPC